MKKVLKALDDKDFSFLTRLMAHRGTDPNKIIEDKGVSLFHLVIGHRSETFAFKVIKLFLRHGGDPNVPSEDGITPVHVAAAWGRTRILHLLLVNGGDPWIQDDEKKNAFNYAFEEQEWDAVEMLHYFQQMYSSASYKMDIEQTPNFELNFEKILLRKGQHMYEYALSNEKNVKSTETQTYSEFNNDSKLSGSSPVLTKIKYFESNPSNSNTGCKRIEKPVRLEKKCYPAECFHSSCDLIVNTPDKETAEILIEEEKGNERGNHFISSIHIDALPLKKGELDDEASVTVLDKSCDKPLHKSSGDVRSQLFVELQEAVLRRSKLMLSKAENAEAEKNYGCELEDKVSSGIHVESNSEPSVVCIPNRADDSFVAKEVSYLYGINLSNNDLLRHMSDFATKVMKEIEVSESENEKMKINERSSNVMDLPSTYLTCEEDSDFRDNDHETGDVIPIERSTVDYENQARNTSVLEASNDSFLSIAEEYRYVDKEEGVVLLEKKLLTTSSVGELMESEEQEMELDSLSLVSDVSSAPSVISYASDTLRSELVSFGFNPGPINKTTKKLYLKKLWRLQKFKRRSNSVKKVYSAELEKTLNTENDLEKVLSYRKFEEEMMKSFDVNSNRKWREGVSKTSFNYLLIDPRVSMNLPKRAVTMSDFEIWKCFLSSVFYIGKGKRARPYAHLYEAASLWWKYQKRKQTNEKNQYIIDIWSEELGVICLHVFQNIIPVEAYTREAAMIDALGISNLKNQKNGDYYGSASTWTRKDKSKFGVYLLYKAMLIFLNEGERQIRPFDII